MRRADWAPFVVVRGGGGYGRYESRLLPPPMDRERAWAEVRARRTERQEEKARRAIARGMA
ncbi:hypothetical protein ABH931_006535 [Streptacidiphilus sp. MAP12-33]|uniref:hypothetical protein n=1 Tax=Streptacidiphilus sp. MAP12-33 TaxID=3156266 RepID=UPI00351692FF